MPAPSLPKQQIMQLSAWVAEYIADQRERFCSKAQSITSKHKAMLQPFFPFDILDSVHVFCGRPKEPAFYAQLRTMGIRNAPQFSQMAGITFQDVVVHTEALSNSLLFHELVHAVQYKHLGLDGFAERYVRGFLTGGSYEEIPLEKQAYELESRFASAPSAHFSVEQDVLERMQSNGF